MDKLNILFTIPLNMVRHDTPTVPVQVLWKSKLSGKFFLISCFANCLGQQNCPVLIADFA